MNLAIFNYVNSFAGQYGWLDKLGIFCAVYLGYLLVAFLLYCFFWRHDLISRRGVVVSIASALIARLGFVSLIRYFFHSPRPFMALDFQPLIPESGYSFPSGHAAFFFALAMGVYLYNPKIGRLFFIAAAIMGVARVFAGVHWPADILGGIGLGILTAIGVDLVLRNRFPSQ